MWQKIQMLPLMVYFAVTNFFDDLRSDERGLSGVIVAVLLILVAVLAIVLLWSKLKVQIGTWWNSIVKKSNELK